jgi:transposase-like protein
MRSELSQKQGRKFTAKQKLESSWPALRKDRSVRDVCREHQIQEALYYQLREQLLVAGAERFAGKEERAAHLAINDPIGTRTCSARAAFVALPSVGPPDRRLNRMPGKFER